MPSKQDIAFRHIDIKLTTQDLGEILNSTRVRVLHFATAQSPTLFFHTWSISLILDFAAGRYCICSYWRFRYEDGDLSISASSV